MNQHASIESVSWDDDGPEYVKAPAGTGYASCTRDEYERLTTPSPERNIAAELAVALDHLAYVAAWATLDGAEQASLSTGIRILRELHTALTA